jgi:hypothetical protein
MNVLDENTNLPFPMAIDAGSGIMLTGGCAGANRGIMKKNKKSRFIFIYFSKKTIPVSAGTPQPQ